MIDFKEIFFFQQIFAFDHSYYALQNLTDISWLFFTVIITITIILSFFFNMY